MKRIIDSILKHKKLVVIIFSAATIISFGLALLVNVNYDLQSYLPQDTPSTKSLEVMSSQFEETIFNVNIMIPDASVTDALDLKEQIKEKEYVLSVLWLDDYVDVTLPVEVLPKETTDQYYKDNNALFMVTVETDNYPPVLAELQELVGDGGHISGRLVELSMAQSATQSEISQILVYAIPVVAIVLILATHSWLEPVLMLLAIAVGIALNMGTNVFLEDISFLTQAVAAILQLAVSMDYAIFLLHRFSDYRKKYDNTEDAMRAATKDALPTLMASSITTFIGFLALVLMRFQIGPDLGIVLAKGVFFSIISVSFFLPSITILFVKWIDKTEHRSFLPSFNWLAKINFRMIPLIIIIVVVVTVPSFLGQRHNEFIYGMGAFQENSRESLDDQAVKDVYGVETQMVVLVPKGQWGQEINMIQEFQTYPEVKSIMSYVTMIGPNIPPEVLPESQISSLLSEDYSRIILQVISAEEGEHAFGLIERVRETIDKYYEEDTHLVGSSVITYDMAQTIQADDIVVNGIAILAIFLTILFTFKSISVPIILVFAIELSIWINLSFPYFTQAPLNYIGYLIISTVQLGATVDYGVLYTQNYLENRQTMNKKDAFFFTVNQSAQSVIPPALILSIVGFILGAVSTIQMVSELGITLGRGATISLLMTLIFVPVAYYLFDSIVEKTTLYTKFLGKEESDEKAH
jgi:predicted RND superfamily exporter protein